MAEGEPLLFDGLRVIDAGTWLAGPVAGTILADYGATVIKIEQPGVGDPYRKLAENRRWPRTDVNSYWALDARNKRSLTLDLASQPGREVLLRLVRTCDVFITNQPLATRRRLRMRYDDLAPENERMVFASLTAYGECGPDAELEGFDASAWWARSGLMDLVRAPGAAPAISVPGMGDHPTALALYAAIVTALLRRERTGKGGMVHTSLLANGIWSNGCYVQAALSGADFDSAAAPTLHPSLMSYETADGRLLQLTMLRTDSDYDRLLIAAGREDVLADPRFADREQRLRHWPALIEVLQELFRKRSARQWLQLFREHRVLVGAVTRMADMAGDEQLQAAGVVVPLADPLSEVRTLVNHPINVEGLLRRPMQRAPSLGEHTGEVLGELGYAPEEIAQLHASGVT